MMDYKIDELIKIYYNGNLVPFIGAGLSMPFNIPNWENIISEISNQELKDQYKPIIQLYLERKDYWEAVKQLMSIANLDELDIQNYVVKIIKDNQKKADDNFHNYKDLAEMNFSNYLTTNYDNWLFEYLEDKTFLPQVLSKVEINSQNFFSSEGKRIWHLHGNISDPGSIVLSEDKYKILYNNEKYDKLLSLFSGGKSLLFIGFSFDDQFIRRLIKDHKSYFNGSHYILLNRPTYDMKKEIKKEYGINVIEYDITNSSHVAEIKKILDSIKEKSISDNIIQQKKK